MQRHRQVAAAPRQRASETWDAITTLVAATLDRSPHISGDDVMTAMGEASNIGRALVAGGHLDKHPVVVIADPVHLSVSTVSGVAAINLDEDLGLVPGGAAATTWTIYLPTPDPLEAAVRSVVDTIPHLSADDPPGDSAIESAQREGAGMLNLDALAQRAQEST